MKKLLPYALLCLPLFCLSGLAQSRAEIDRVVYEKLQQIKPKNTREAKYSIVLPKSEAKLPADHQLDIVYKIGHYQWELGALRFERSSNDEMVAITKLTHSSAFGFYREWSPGEDKSAVLRATMPKADFGWLLRTALRFYEADIVRKPLDMMGCSSSGDGTFMFNLAGTGENKNRGPLSKKGNGRIVGDILHRAECGYDEVRDTLFWEVFDNYLKANVLFVEMEQYRVEDLLLDRMNDQPIADNYLDYFRRSLLVHILGDVGTERSLPALQHAGDANLDDSWKKHLREDAENSSRKIRARTSPQN